MVFKKSNKGSFLTDNELTFYKEMFSFLFKNYHTKYQLLAQVRMADLCYIKRSLLKKYWSVDFVICDLENDMKPVVAIELNWWEHYWFDWRKEADTRKGKLLKKNNIPLVTIKNEELKDLSKRIYEINDILNGRIVENNVANENNIQEKLKLTQNVNENKINDKSNCYMYRQKASHKNAYEKWTEDDDELLIKSYNEWKTISELMQKFGRNYWWIVKHLRKLWAI